MQAARFHEAADTLSLEEIDRPAVGPTDVLVDLKAASFCGSDLNYLMGKTEPGNVPITLGHEGAGIVEETGDAVTHVEEGDRVVIHYVQSCGHCDPCLDGNDNQCRNRQSIGHHVDGTFAEYIAIPERCALKLPEPVSFEDGAIAGCAVSTAYHAVDRGAVSPSDDVVVFGIGGVGLHAVLWAEFNGANTVIAVDLSDPQLEAARDYGADVTLNPERDDVLERIDTITDGWGADVALECSGSSTAMEQAIDSVGAKHGYETGNVVSVGIQTEDIEVGFGDVREGMLCVSGDHTRSELGDVSDLLESGRVDLSTSITHTLQLENINDAIPLMTDSEERVGRIIIDTS
ncbi:zinc-dependent alcohol dehydrogenase [Halosimplex amylolyticum]|uniref:zinc-dependent alcohol dehydrogenase n=1 Tax=Halosimplex amylolyticum TaxID=3396616 RepID=UPI003F56A842